MKKIGKMNRPTYKELVKSLRETQKTISGILDRIENKKVYLKKIKKNTYCIDPDGKNCYFRHSDRCMEFDCSGIIYVQVPKPNGENNE